MLRMQRKLWWPRLCNCCVSGLNLSKQQKTRRLTLRDCRVWVLLDDIARLVWWWDAEGSNELKPVGVVDLLKHLRMMVRKRIV